MVAIGQKLPSVMTTDNYTPPSTLQELMQRYALGERHFPNVDLSEANLSRVTLDGASFGPHSWFSSADFTGASLRGTSFSKCNVKCATFTGADLTNATFEDAAIESIGLDGAASRNELCWCDVLRHYAGASRPVSLRSKGVSQF